jgi:uncharacterized iron-regulated membrane protein
MKPSWIFWHRWSGVISCIGLILWGASGISHPVMTRLQPSPVAFTAPNQIFDLSQAISPQVLLKQHGIEQIAHLGLSALNGKTYYRVSENPNAAARYFNTETGDELPNGDATLASALASHFTGRPLADITRTELITEFSDDYHAINRFLPAWRIEFSGNDHLRAFIDTEQLRLATLVDDKRYIFTKLFRIGHNWSFIENTPRVQLGIMAGILSLILFSAFSGIYLFIKQAHLSRIRLANQGIRRWHRWLGITVSLATLLLASSGLFHLAMNYKQQYEAIPASRNLITTTQLNQAAWDKIKQQPLAKLDLTQQADQPYWFLLPAHANTTQPMPVAQVGILKKEASQDMATSHTDHHEHHGHQQPETIQPHVIPADSPYTPPKEDSVKLLAQAQAASYAGMSMDAIQSTEWMNEFGSEYGFIFKRLPVIKVQFPGNGNPRYFIEPSTGILAAKITDIDHTEGWVFSHLHKWSFLDSNKMLRDILVSLFALGNIIIGTMGIILFTRHIK